MDVTIPGREVKLGHKHPMYLALDEIKDIFIGMGFTVLDGPGGGAGRVQLRQAQCGGGTPLP